MKTKTPADSAVQMRHIVMPGDANPYGTIFGGVVLSWVDLAAAMVAERHTASQVVTVHIEDISFKAPIKIGQHVLINAAMNYVGNSSMLIGVKVLAEDPKTGNQTHATTAYLTFVALDDQGNPTSAIKLNPITEDEKRRFNEGEKRLKARKST